MSSTEDLRRTRSIEKYDLVRRPPRWDLLAIVELAAQICGTPMATINLVTDTEQHSVAAHGFDASVCRREDSMCAAVLDDQTPVVVPDARLDDRFKDNPFVTGDIGSVRFYASHKLTTLDGVVIGTLCVFDVVARVLDPSQVEALGTLAERVVDVLELSLRSRELAASNERLATFAGRVSHDLKTPLAGVSLSLSLLRDHLADRPVDDDDASWLLERAISSSERMAALIDEALSFASVGGVIASVPVALDAVLDEVLADLAVPLADAEITRRPLPVVHGDVVQLRSVLQNLLDNAAKYRRPDRRLAVAVSADVLGERWRVAVADNGPGIPEAERERVFEPRVRLSDDDLGSGIGLDTVRQVVQAHGGAIGIAETPGGGTTVWFDLPA